MAVPEQIPYVGYIANGESTEFPITFDLHDPAYLVVTVNKEIPAVGDFTVSDGKVVFLTAPDDGAQVELYRDTVLNRNIEYKSYDNSFRPETINFDLDQTLRILQEQHMIDGKIAARIKDEIEWRRTHDANFDELAKMRDAQIFTGLKQYLDTILAAANPNIFDGITAGIVFALDNKSVQTHLEEIADSFAEIRQEIEAIEDGSTEAINAERDRALGAENALSLEIVNEKTARIAGDENLQLQITTSKNGIKYFSTLTELNAFTPSETDPKQAYVFETKKNYLWDATNAAWLDEGESQYDMAAALINAEVTERKSLIYLNEIGAIIDDFGFVIARVDPTLNLLEMRVSLLVQTINSRDTTFRVVDEYGFGVDIFNIINAIKQKIAELQNAGSTFAAIDVSKPLIVKNYAVWSGEILSLDVSSLVQDKAYQRQFEQVIATVNNLTTNTESSSKVKLNIAATTSTAKFSLRDVKDQSNRSLLNVNIFNVPNNTTALKILMIGDSITDTSGGAALTNYFLSQHTYVPTFIGTKKGVSQTINGTTAPSQNDEARAGWKAANYTNTETKTAVSDVAAYLALSDADKRTYNPFIRPTVTGDDASLIKNGYVFDVADYLSKFSLDTPDVIYIGLGTNDITYSNFGERDEFATQFYIDMKIIVSQCRAAAPSSKIILSIQPTAFTADRNLLWESHYYYAIRVLQRLAGEYSNVVVAPLYALSAAEIDYNFTTSETDAISGVQYGAISDPVHPRNAVLYQTYNVLSAYIAAAINGQI